jgi:hypothetical protein
MSEGSSDETVATLLFSGHRIDAPGRSADRFPARIEADIRDQICTAVEAEWRCRDQSGLRAISSAANGGDILFLECCSDIGIAAEVFLALPPDEFCDASVADGGQAWVDRYRSLCAEFPVRVLEPEVNSADNVFQQTNRWMLDTALALDGGQLTLIALWDGADGDGAGGTGDMVRRAEEAGARIVRINPLDFLGR